MKKLNQKRAANNADLRDVRVTLASTIIYLHIYVQLQLDYNQKTAGHISILGMTYFQGERLQQ
ncbi:MAG: hypothetical protein N2235_20110 [Fischerella sp.]|nr:hypothetical protein [Fischerella sp.]